MATTNVLSGAMALIQRGHCTGPNAKDAKGGSQATDPNAVCWSIYGALLRVTGGPPHRGVIYGAARIVGGNRSMSGLLHRLAIDHVVSALPCRFSCRFRVATSRPRFGKARC